jgi:ferredoxin
MTVKIVVDRGRCSGIGICESLAPDIFGVGDDGSLVLLREDVEDRALAEEAVRGCPAAALSIEESSA